MRTYVRGALAGAVLVSLFAIVSTTTTATAASSGVTKSKQVSRVFVEDGEMLTVDERKVTVAVDTTRDLRGRERIEVSWSGAHPSGGRSTNPFGEKGLAQEYPVVLLQCRGLDDTKLAAAKRVSPRTCWTSTAQQRFRSSSERLAIWRRDPYASAADQAQKSGIDPFPTTGCDDAPQFSAHAVPFIAANGTTYASCSATTMAPEAAADASYPPAEQAAFTDADGTGSASFEVRTSTENESLGCSDAVPCSLVVIPIQGVSCSEGDSACQKTGRFAPGSSNIAGEGVDDPVSAAYWWAASNWRNRISIPLDFAPAPNVCDVLDSRTPTAFYGTELMSQAALQWAPAFCLNAKRFKFQQNSMPDTAAFRLVEDGEASAALVSGKRTRETQDPIVYAPTAVTGFAISYVIDRPDNAGEYTRLRLTPRLLAKLLTQSYTGSAYGAQHPGMIGNPQSINQDPEFRKLNPGLDDTAREAGATLLSLSTSSDVIASLTSYIARDAAAMAFVDGKADPHGMVVNPSYKGLDLPVSEWPLKDEFVPAWTQECQRQYTTPYFTQLAAPVSSLRTIAEAVLDGWPNIQTKCELDTGTGESKVYKTGRTDRQSMGARFMLGLTSLGDAARLGLDTATLQTSSATFVAPDATSMAAAIGQARKDANETGLFNLTQQAIAKKANAYPGTMIVYTAARTSGLGKADARNVAQFIRVSTSEGQQAGRGNGQLPEGFLPIRRTGATAPLFAAAQASAALIAAQQGAVAAPSRGAPSSGDGTQDSSTGDAPGSDEVPEAAGAKTATKPAAVVETVPTAATTSRSGRLAVPLLLLIGLTMGALGPILRRAARRGAAR